MTDSDLTSLRERAAHGDQDAIDQLVELAAERGDAADVLAELAGDHDTAE